MTFFHCPLPQFQPVPSYHIHHLSPILTFKGQGERERKEAIGSLMVMMFNNGLLGFKYDSSRSTTHPKFGPTGIWTHDLQIMTAHFMSLRRLLSPLGYQWLPRQVIRVRTLVTQFQHVWSNHIFYQSKMISLNYHWVDICRFRLQRQ